MNANKQDAGGLPELPEPVGHVHSDYEYCAERPFKNDGWPVSVYEATQVRAYGELCRAASAGGDSLRALVKELRESLEGVVRVADRNTDEFDRAREAIARASHVFVNAGDSEAQFIADGENLDCPACGGSGHAGDSAPAGSGEVGELIDRLETEARLLVGCIGRSDQSSDVRALRDAAALLRKLQQGEGYVMVPREPSNAMVLAAIDRDDSAEDASPDGMYVGIYRAMVDASDRGAK